MERLKFTADDMVAEARELLARRLSPEETYSALQAGEAVLLDIRPYEQQVRDGLIPGAVLINTNVFEYRCDPSSPDDYREPTILPDEYSQQLVVICNQGYKSSLQAANLVRMGLHNATDVEGGMEAWLAAGLPVVAYEHTAHQ